MQVFDAAVFVFKKIFSYIYYYYFSFTLFIKGERKKIEYGYLISDEHMKQFT